MREGRVLTVNVGKPRLIEWLDHVEETAIWKSSVEGRVAVRGTNVEGDEQADKRAHGGPDKAIYSYAREDEDWWAAQLGRPVDLGGFGENLTLEGVDVTGAVVGERWEVGSAVLEVAQPRIPCWKLGARMDDPEFPTLFGAALRPGAYLRIVREGDIGTGDSVRVIHRPDHGVTVGEVARIYHTSRGEAHRLLEVRELAYVLKRWAARRQR